MLTDSSDAAIARAIIALGQSLNLTVIAEGVETEAQRDLPAGYGCRAFRGYFFGRPGLPTALPVTPVTRSWAGGIAAEKFMD